MKHFNHHSLTRWLLGLLSLVTTTLNAFPPAPHFTLYGMVRDEWGWVIDQPDSFLVVKFENREVARSAILPYAFDRNYEVAISMVGPTNQPYKSTALQPLAPLSIEVHTRGTILVPLETQIRGTYTGQPGDTVMVNLKLGADTDRDGLPDLWEEWQLAEAGIYAGQAGFSLDAISPGQDSDGDGVTNLQEYLAGTLALFADDNFLLEVITVHEGDLAEFAFLAVTDKTYRIERSTDMVHWETTAFRTTLTPAANLTSFTAASVTRQTVFIQPSSPQPAYYRLLVR